MMNGTSRQISPAARTARDSRHSEPVGIRIRFVPVIGGAVLLLGYLAFRAWNSSPASASSDPVTTPPPQPVVVAKRYVTRPAVVSVDPIPDPAVTANPPSRPQRAPAPLPAQVSPEAVPSSAAQEVIARVGQPDFFTGGVSPQQAGCLAKGLEKQLPPDQFRWVVLAAASETLAQALSGAWNGRNVTPLFEVLQKYGDEGVIGLLEKSSSKWNFYATLALAGMPDGAGSPAL